MTTPTALSRLLPYETVFNLRDFGGYLTAQGRAVRTGRLFRSGAVHAMSADEAQDMHNKLGLRVVLDLRRADEIESEGQDLGPLVALVARRHNHSIIPLPDSGATTSLSSVSGLLDERHGLGPSGARYASYLEIGAGAIGAVIRALAREETYPALVHCSAGKDRTGVVCALVLSTLGVDDDTIVADYALSNLSTSRLLERFGIEVEVTPEVQRIYGAPPEAMSDFLQCVRTNWGDAPGYLASIGLSDTELERLRDLLLERA